MPSAYFSYPKGISNAEPYASRLVKASLAIRFQQVPQKVDQTSASRRLNVRRLYLPLACLPPSPPEKYLPSCCGLRRKASGVAADRGAVFSARSQPLARVNPALSSGKGRCHQLTSLRKSGPEGAGRAALSIAHIPSLSSFTSNIKNTPAAVILCLSPLNLPHLPLSYHGLTIIESTLPYAATFFDWDQCQRDGSLSRKTFFGRRGHPCTVWLAGEGSRHGTGAGLVPHWIVLCGTPGMAEMPPRRLNCFASDQKAAALIRDHSSLLVAWGFKLPNPAFLSTCVVSFGFRPNPLSLRKFLPYFERHLSHKLLH